MALEAQMTLRMFVLVAMASTVHVLSSSFSEDLGTVPLSKVFRSETRFTLIQSLRALLSRQLEAEVHQPEIGHPGFSDETSSRTGKRGGLGRCIHNCMNSRGGLNFIQCKTMCS
uniref:Teretoxin Tan14.1 n=1 Tax=Terebra anilis TaxID=553697 RepID=TE1_TERAN|nr:RecName: Full=Teretoxin Tan14.1; Flags: Precursor [Terebra anilis]